MDSDRSFSPGLSVVLPEVLSLSPSLSLSRFGRLSQTAHACIVVAITSLVAVVSARTPHRTVIIAPNINRVYQSQSQSHPHSHLHSHLQFSQTHPAPTKSKEKTYCAQEYRSSPPLLCDYKYAWSVVARATGMACIHAGAKKRMSVAHASYHILQQASSNEWENTVVELVECPEDYVYVCARDYNLDEYGEEGGEGEGEGEKRMLGREEVTLSRLQGRVVVSLAEEQCDNGWTETVYVLRNDRDGEENGPGRKKA
ncbi:hypothetical protein C8Q77DRAFT_407382 [Trametes polyzona]|nr:hypothetical protein C8Q77DRAFT_407382 [Trametes polyzona]